MKRLTLVLAVLIGSVASPVAGQTQSPGPRVEIGGHIGAFTVTDFGDSDAIFLWGPRVSARVTDKLTVELSMDLKTHGSGGYHSLYGLYYLTGKYSFHRSRVNGAQIFATFGGVGSFFRTSWPGYSYTRYDGVRISMPAGHHSNIERPSAVVGGIGAERPINRHVAARVSAEAIYGGGAALGLRLCGGFSVPIGTYRSN